MEKKYTISDKAYKNKKAYINKYNKEKYDRILLAVPAGKKDYYKNMAEKRGLSLNRLFIEAVEEFLRK